MISGIVIAILMCAFFALVSWAWSAARHEAFAKAAATPLNDEEHRS